MRVYGEKMYHEVTDMEMHTIFLSDVTRAPNDSYKNRNCRTMKWRIVCTNVWVYNKYVTYKVWFLRT